MTALALVPWGAHAAAGPNAQELVVTLAPGSSAAEGRRAAAAMGGRVVGSIPRLDAFLVQLGSPLPPRVLDSAVRSVEPNTADRVDALPSDSLRPLQWSLTTIGIDELWEATLGDPSVTIAIVDTGVDYTHPEFAGRIVLGPDLADGDEDPIDTEGHGTAVAALAAASDDGQGIVGACPRCSVVAVKVAPDGSGAITKFASAAGIVWAADHGADVINLSFGGTDPDDVQRDAVAYAHSRGAIVVASAGNRGKGGVQYPAAYEQVIAVGASDRNDRPTPLTSYGPWVDLAAPGVTLLAPSLAGGAVPRTGTSFAAPLVAGIAGLVASLRPNATPAETTTAVLAGTVPLRPALYGRDRPMARGRLHVPMLLAKLAALGSPTPTIARVVVPLAVSGRRLTVRARVLRDDTGNPLTTGNLRCSGRLGKLQLATVAVGLGSGSARCTWRLPAGSGGRTLSGSLAIESAGFTARHDFTAPVHRS